MSIHQAMVPNQVGDHFDFHEALPPSSIGIGAQFDQTLIKLRAQGPLFSIVLLGLLNPLFTVLFWLISMRYPQMSLGINPVFRLPVPAMLLALVVVAPVLETLIFQTFLIKFLRFALKLGKLPVVLISAALFAAGHPISMAYVVFTFIAGFGYATFYMSRTFAGGRPLLWVAIAHAMGNAMALSVARLAQLF